MGKAKDGSKCYTREKKSGEKYITCEGSQKASKPQKKVEKKPVKKKQSINDKWKPYKKNFSDSLVKKFETRNVLKEKRKNLKQDLEELKSGENYDEERIKEYKRAVMTSVAATEEYSRLSDFKGTVGDTPIGTSFYFASGKDSVYFPNPRAKGEKKVATKEQKEQKKMEEEKKDKKEDEFISRTEEAKVLWDKYKNGNWDKTDKKFIEEELNEGYNPNINRAEIIEAGKTKVKKLVIYWKERWTHTRWKKSKPYRLPKEFQ
jgi:hypothetical protein